jgi:HSP20 family protein
VLTINAESHYEHEDRQEGGRVIRQERRYGKYVRSIRLGKDVDEEKVKANYKDGVLELELPKVEEVKPKKISVNVS